jgi:predicted peroxiredoxin
MALNMAVLMSENKDVLVYVDITGIKAFLKDGEDIKFGEFPSSHTQIKKLLEKGIILSVCPGCLKNAGKTEGDVMSGVKIASKEAFFNFTKGRILSLSY